MAWAVKFTDIAAGRLHKLDRQAATRILRFFRTRVVACDDPLPLAKALHGDKKGLWRFRIGDYRAICDVRQEERTVLVLEIAHRREVYR